MRRILTWIAPLAIAVLQVTAANAATFTWSYKGVLNPSISGSGQFQADDQGGGIYLITSVSGSISGSPVTGAIGPGTGLEDVFGGPDQLLSTSSPQLSLFGFSFLVAGSAFNLFYDNGQVCSDVASYCLLGPGTPGQPADVDTPFVPVTFEASLVGQTPLPAALPLFASGMGVLGWVGLRRRKQTRA